MYTNVVESKMTNRLKVYKGIMTYALSIYEMKFLAYYMLWKVINFLLNLLFQCDEWWVWASIRPSRCQVCYVTSSGWSQNVTDVVSEHEVYKVIFG